MKNKKYIKGLLIRGLLALILFLSLSIYLNYNDQNVLFFKRNFYDKALNFSTFNNLYQRWFGSPLPDPDTLAVSNNIMGYTEVNSFHDGAALKGVNTVTPFKSGIVVFVGEKDHFGHTIIIQGMDGIDYWYGNVTDVAVKIYDYIQSDKIIANAKDNKLYILFMKNGEVLDFEEFI